MGCDTFDGYDAVKTFLQAALMPHGHRFYLVLKKDEVFLLCWMGWLLNGVMMQNDRGMRTKVKRIWEKPGVIQIGAADGLHGGKEG